MRLCASLFSCALNIVACGVVAASQSEVLPFNYQSQSFSTAATSSGWIRGLADDLHVRLHATLSPLGYKRVELSVHLVPTFLTQEDASADSTTSAVSASLNKGTSVEIEGGIVLDGWTRRENREHAVGLQSDDEVLRHVLDAVDVALDIILSEARGNDDARHRLRGRLQAMPKDSEEQKLHRRAKTVSTTRNRSEMQIVSAHTFFPAGKEQSDVNRVSGRCII